MKEAFVILLIIVVLLSLTAIRYRKQIAAMIHVYRSLQKMRQQVKGKQAEPADNISAGNLINCAKCGTWIPEQRAIKLKGGIYFCSSACVESATAV